MLSFTPDWLWEVSPLTPTESIELSEPAVTILIGPFECDRQIHTGSYSQLGFPKAFFGLFSRQTCEINPDPPSSRVV